MQKLWPGPQALNTVQQKQQVVTQAWEALQLRMEQRRAQLEQAHLLARFHTAVRAFPRWEGHMCAQTFTCTEALTLWKENCAVRGAGARVCGPGRTGWMMTEKPSDRDV